MSDEEEHELCEQCGFDGAQYSDRSLLNALKGLGNLWREVLADAGSDLRTRPEPEVWSALEYAAHSRDVTALHCFGVNEALRLNEPDFGEVDGDAMINAAAASYNDEEVAPVLDALELQTRALSSTAREAGTEAWSRGVTIGGERSSIRRLLEHALHDSTHHLDDVERNLALLRTTR